MKIQGKSGKQFLANGVEADIRLTKEAGLLVSPSSSKYENQSLDGDLFIGSNALGTPVTTQAGLSATTPALTLYNPVNSGVNLILQKVNIGVTTAPAANTVFALAYNEISANAPSSVTNATIVSGQIGSNKAPAGKCYRVATLAAAPVAFKYLGGILAASSTNECSIKEDIDGEVVVIPGGCISIQSTTAVAILASFTWKEQPIN